MTKEETLKYCKFYKLGKSCNHLGEDKYYACLIESVFVSFSMDESDAELSLLALKYFGLDSLFCELPLLLRAAMYSVMRRQAPWPWAWDGSYKNTIRTAFADWAKKNYISLL